MDKLEGQTCPLCMKKTLTLTEDLIDIPFFGKTYVFGMNCNNEDCEYKKSDLEAAEQKEPCRYTIELSSEEDMNIRIVKSSEATIKIPHVTTITPGPASNGEVTNVESILLRIKEIIEQAKESAEDNAEKKKAKNLIKKLQKVMWGQEKLKFIIEDPSGNSAIISDKVEKKKL